MLVIIGIRVLQVESQYIYINSLAAFVARPPCNSDSENMLLLNMNSIIGSEISCVLCVRFICRLHGVYPGNIVVQINKTVKGYSK